MGTVPRPSRGGKLQRRTGRTPRIRARTKCCKDVRSKRRTGRLALIGVRRGAAFRDGSYNFFVLVVVFVIGDETTPTTRRALLLFVGPFFYYAVTVALGASFHARTC